MAVLFMCHRTPNLVLITVMLRMAAMVMDFTAITGLGHASTVGEGEADFTDGIEAENMNQ